MDRRGRELQQVATGPERTRRAHDALWPPAAVVSVGPAARPLSRPRPRRSTRTASVPLRLAVAATVGALLYVALDARFAGRSAAPARPAVEDQDLGRLLGLGLDQVAVDGNSRTPAEAIFDALDLANVRTQLSFDPAAARARIERLPWIASASVTRVLPDGLSVVVAERTPAVLWLHDGRSIALDRTGRILGPVDMAFGSMLKIAGQGAPAAAPEVLAWLGRFPELAERLRLAERAGERRWTLELTNGTRILLPAEGADERLARLFEGQTGGRLIDRPSISLDLRVPRMTVVAGR